MSRKRKEPPPQSSTLHNFFEAPGRRAPSLTPYKKSFSSNHPPAKIVKQESQEVIIIESDEEVECQVLNHKGPKQAEVDFSDVEIVEVDSARHSKQDRPILRETSTKLENVKAKVTTTPSPSLSTTGNEENVYNYTSKSCPERCLSRARTAIPDGRQSSEIEISEMRKRFYGEDDVTETIHTPQDVGRQYYEVPGKDESYAMDWDVSMADDELSYFPRDENGVEDSFEDTVVELNADAPADSSLLADDLVAEECCPMCCLSFRNMNGSEKEGHVNGCLDTSDTPQQGQPVASSSKPKILKPLSSFFTLSTSCSVANKPTKRSNSNAFSVLMSKHDEKGAWEEAQVVEDRNFKPTKANGGRRKAPFYKILQGMPIAVDAFRYGAIPGITAYFLTHAHSDHYTNLSSNWKNGPIYCSETTANLVVHMLSVDKNWVRPLPMDTPTLIPNSGGVEVTLIEANHCPGSCLFLFEGPQTVNAGDSTYKSSYVGTKRTFRYLHCGDFRACPKHVLHPAVKGKRIDHVYLDTTYLNPKYCFPPQPLVISACAELARRIVTGENIGEMQTESVKTSTNASIDKWMIKNEESDFKGKQKLSSNGDVLVVVGTYSIGKERIVKAIAQALKTKVYCDARKAAILRCQSDPELHALLTKNPLEAGVHVVPLGMVASDRFQDYMDRWKGRWARAVAFRPTGWTYTPPSGTDLSPSIPQVLARQQSRLPFTHLHLRPARNSTATLMQYGVPYSEHSSFFELTAFALSFEWARMIATVNVGSASSRGKMERWVEKWDAERRRRKKDGEDAIVKFRAEDYW